MLAPEGNSAMIRTGLERNEADSRRASDGSKGSRPGLASEGEWGEPGPERWGASISSRSSWQNAGGGIRVLESHIKGWRRCEDARGYGTAA